MVGLGLCWNEADDFSLSLFFSSSLVFVEADAQTRTVEDAEGRKVGGLSLKQREFMSLSLLHFSSAVSIYPTAWISISIPIERHSWS